MSAINITALELHQKENYATLRAIYTQFYSDTDKSNSGWNQIRDHQISSDPDIFSRLTISIPPEEMRGIFDKHGVIALRRLQNSDLLVFCGNRPLYMVDTPYSENARDDHAHEGFDTVDYNLLMNPHCVIQWPPDPQSTAYLSTKPYQTVNGEHMSVLDFSNIFKFQQGLKSLQQMLKKEGSSQCTYTFVPEELNRLSAQYYLWGHEVPLWRRIYNNLFTRSWYAEGVQWLWSNGTVDEELKIIAGLARLHGFEITIGESSIRRGVYCGSEYVTYPSPVQDYLLTLTKK